MVLGGGDEEGAEGGRGDERVDGEDDAAVAVKQLPVEGATAGEDFDLLAVCGHRQSGGGASQESHVQDFVTVAQELLQRYIIHQ